MFAEILPIKVKTAILMGFGDESHLLPDELPYIRNAVPKRIGDFAGGRYCAREALKSLSIAPCPILVGPRREPIWPRGIVGSITHCQGCCAAAVGCSDDFRSIGIDVEPHQPLPEGVRSMVISQWEQKQIAHLPQGVHWDRLLFSAKESVYKAWYPMTGMWLDFLDATLEFEPANQSFSLEIQKSSIRQLDLPSKWCGRYGVSDQFVFTALTVD